MYSLLLKRPHLFKILFFCVFCAPLFCQDILAAPATPVITKNIQITSISPAFETLGTLKANESIVLSATVTDTISGIYFDDGGEVKAGDVLVEMTNAEEKAEVNEAESAYAEAKRQYNRLTTLIKTDSTSQSLLDERRLAYESSKARLAAAKARLQDHIILAPFDGRVGLRNISLGSLVTPGDVITTLDNVNILKLDMTLPSTALDSVNVGMSINTIALANEQNQYTGTIRSIDTRVDPITRSIVVRAIIKNNDLSLRPGMQMRAYITSAPRDAILIPEEALIRNGNKEFVFIVEGEGDNLKAKRQEIKTDGRYQGQFEVVNGVHVGDKVIIHGMMKLKPGSNIRILAEETDNETLDELLQSSKSQEQ